MTYVIGMPVVYTGENEEYKHYGIGEIQAVAGEVLLVYFKVPQVKIKCSANDLTEYTPESDVSTREIYRAAAMDCVQAVVERYQDPVMHALARSIGYEITAMLEVQLLGKTY
ncbi:hypothetical protein KCG48_04870 [Proteiniclasticum sp. BAD-10]|uniref:Uncharacterized protein n=1 Tax=Proteiniclasticum sediminis TaxID=2804028 RepID=A0A941CP71_9CLOT|nr:hypothetical protein [Proteiniclasticum sediminis]MBR0575672.1 hypothetical protein [Proteiniclasticum sediminis]